jgi:alpha-beta hydrolase superfamily lysophospholipase
VECKLTPQAQPEHKDRENRISDQTNTLEFRHMGYRLHARFWPAAQPLARASVLIAHGMGEHSGRYQSLAGILNNAGFHVLAPDLRGHGLSRPEYCAPGDMGYDGWRCSLLDLRLMQEWLTINYMKPVILIGHSMGAMLAQQYLGYFGHTLAACLLSGSTGALRTLTTLGGELLASLDSQRLGPQAPSPILTDNLFAANNKHFENLANEPDQQGFNWLSRDPEQVATYIADPLCGAVLCSSSLAGMFGGLRRSSRASHIACIPKNLPIRFISGADDPVHNNGRGIRRLVQRYEKAQLSVTSKLYPGGRHEMFNETNRAEVFEDLLLWLQEIDLD